MDQGLQRLLNATTKQELPFVLDNKVEIDSEQVVYSTTVEMLLWEVKKRSCECLHSRKVCEQFELVKRW